MQLCVRSHVLRHPALDVLRCPVRQCLRGQQQVGIHCLHRQQQAEQVRLGCGVAANPRVATPSRRHIVAAHAAAASADAPLNGPGDNSTAASNVVNDVFGGLTCAIVALPLALAFGYATGVCHNLPVAMHVPQLANA